jgi:hypothetical protein
MKVLAMFTSSFGYHPAVKNIDDVEEVKEGNIFNDCIVAFIQI